MAIEVHVIKMYLDTQLNAVISKIPYTMTQKPVPVFTFHPLHSSDFHIDFIFASQVSDSLTLIYRLADLPSVYMMCFEISWQPINCMKQIVENHTI